MRSTAERGNCTEVQCIASIIIIIVDHYLLVSHSHDTAMAFRPTSSLLLLSVLCYFSRSVLSSRRNTARLSGLVGAPSELSQKALESESVRQAAQYAVQQLNLGSSSTTPHVLVKVLSGTSQVSLTSPQSVTSRYFFHGRLS